jgi:hypothetical protein
VPFKEYHTALGGRSPCGPPRKELQTVEIDGTDHTSGDDAAASESNVVRIPRDWFGPREELVPFGPSDPEDPPPPVRADDFWGEDSASIQNAMRAPEVVGPARVEAQKVEGETVEAVTGEAETGEAETLNPETLEPETGEAETLERGRRGLGIAAVKRRGRPGRSRAFVVPARRIRPRTATAAVAASCLLVMAAIGSFWPAPVRSPLTDHASAGLSPAVIGSAVPPITTRTSRVGRATHARGTGARRGRGHQIHAHLPSRARSSGGNRTAVAASSSQSDATLARSTTTASSESAQSSPPSSASASPSSGASSSGSSSSSGASSTGASSGAGGGNSSRQSAGPEGPGAPFGPGHLG